LFSYPFIFGSIIMKTFSSWLDVASCALCIVGGANGAPQLRAHKRSACTSPTQALAISSTAPALSPAGLVSRSVSLPSAITLAAPVVSSSALASPPIASTAGLASTSSTGSPEAPQSSGKVRFAGVNIAGFDFGCGIDGTCNTASTFDVVDNGNGIQQMQHFVKDDGLNAFRLPVGWQYLVNNQLGGPLDTTNLATYDKLVQGCVSSGAAMCIIDVHNYARYNGMIIGQTPGGPTNEQYASLLSQLATKYKNQSQIAFDIMNEPHDIPNLAAWGNSSQVAVNAIRNAGATNQTILLPGTDFASADTFISSGSAAILNNITNPSGGTDNLVSP
jgi:endoglucanase